MFLFEKLDVYQKSLTLSAEVYDFFKMVNIDKILKNQLPKPEFAKVLAPTSQRS
jgi:hypothetical protein